MNILNGPLDIKKKSNDRGVQRSVQEFCISSSARSVPHIKSMQNVLVFLVFLAHHENRSNNHIARSTGQPPEALFETSPQKIDVFSLVLKTFKRFRATALGTQGKNRTSNGTGVLQQVLSKSLTALGFYSMFCFGGTKWFSANARREQRGGYMDANEEAKKK